MTTETITVANLKCDGCATTIKNELLKLQNVQSVDVNIETDGVNVTYDGDMREKVVEKLHDLGYPEATEKNGLLLQLKSYASCMVGRVSKMNN